MKVYGIWVMLMVFGTPLISSTGGISETKFSNHGENMGIAARCRKLKEDVSPSIDGKSGSSTMNIEDYGPLDPAVPSSKASVRPGPIQHGTPLMPFIPKPSPPGHPKVIDTLLVPPRAGRGGGRAGRGGGRAGRGGGRAGRGAVAA